MSVVSPDSAIPPAPPASVVATTSDGLAGSLANAPNTYRDPVTGAPAVRSSQTLSLDFIKAVVTCYKNLAWSPTLILLYMVFNVLAFAIILGADGPIHSLNAAVNKIRDDATQYQFVRTIAKWIYILTLYLLRPLIFKLFVVQVLLWIPYFAKPSSKNLYIMMVLTGFSLLFIELDLILWVFMSHLWFIYVEIRNPAYKSFMMLIFVFYFIFAWVDLSEALIKNAKENYDKSVAGPSRPS